MARRRTFRFQLYRGARDLGNLEAAEKGSGKLRQAGRTPAGVSVDQQGHGEVPAAAGVVGRRSGKKGRRGRPPSYRGGRVGVSFPHAASDPDGTPDGMCRMTTIGAARAP